MAEHSDSKNYYRILGVSPEGSAEEVERAYRALVLQRRPDAEPNDPAVAARTQAMDEAYAVLSDPRMRAEYDAACATQKPQNPQLPAIAPIVCSACGAVSPQPRYVILHYVISVVFATFPQTIEGIFCPSCAPKRAVLASAITWPLGWWGFPFGPIYAIGALTKNLSNGTRPGNKNALILKQQALYFWSHGQRELAAAIIDQALCCAESAPLRESLCEIEDAMAKAIAPARKAPLVDRWTRRRGWGFWTQVLVPGAMLLGLLVLISPVGLTETMAQRKLAHAGAAGLPVLAEPKPTAAVAVRLRPFENYTVSEGLGANGYQRVVVRGLVGYLPTRDIAYGDGIAEERARCLPSGPADLSTGEIIRQALRGPHKLVVTNELPADAVVKLRDYTGSSVLSFYVEAGDQAIIDTVPEGTFLVEYASGREYSLDCGYFVGATTSFRFGEKVSFEVRDDGINRYRGVLELTLRRGAGGNMRPTNIDNATFSHD